ncbi:hypothetical protein AUJ38_00090 [bacterium CG1_02_42_9]|nr:MAG: hypothetical protein AUJ38_00090 [bacterium CG1_02_42_9]
MEKEQQHTVSECYLENFSDEEGYVWVLDISDKIFRVKPNNILKERHFYTLTSINQEKNFAVEDFLGRIESDYINVFRKKLSKNLFLTDEERVIVSAFIAALMDRTRPQRNALKSSLQKIKDWMGERQSRPDIDSHIKAAIPSSGRTISFDSLKYGLEHFEEYHSASIPRTLSHRAALIYHMKWSVWINKDYGFVTSDDPVVLLRPASIKKFGFGSLGSAPGLRWKDVELTLPLSKDRLLLAGWILNEDSYMSANNEMARNIDHRTITHSHDRIIASLKARAEDIKSRYNKKKIIKLRNS